MGNRSWLRSLFAVETFKKDKGLWLSLMILGIVLMYLRIQRSSNPPLLTITAYLLGSYWGYRLLRRFFGRKKP